MKKIKDYLLTMLIFLFAGVFCFSGYKIIDTIRIGQKEQQAFDNLASKIVTEAKDEVMETIVTDEEILASYQEFYNENNHFYGWVMIEGTQLNYPVMWTPNNPEYYLRKAFDKTYAESGTPFLDALCTEEGQHYILYGHNMRNGTMFNTVTLYKDKSFWEEHPVVQFDTLTDRYQYEVIAAFDTIVNEENFPYYVYQDLSDPEVFNEYLNGINEMKFYDTGIAVDSEDVLLTLSTCSYHAENGRFVIVAKRVEK